MLARYLRAQVTVLVCGGIIGPIFIAAYFFAPKVFGSAGPLGPSYVPEGFDLSSSSIRHAIGWMLWVGLLITVADVLVALWLARSSAKSSAKSAALHQTGVLTTAQIIGLAETGLRINERPVVNLDLHIAGPGFQFDTRERVAVDITKQAIITARKLVVLVDPNTRDYEIDWRASALLGGVVPAQFTVAEDNQTYDLSGQAGPLMEIFQILKANHIPLDRMVDVRSNPVLRQQVQAVVRRAAQQQAPAAQSVPVATAPQQSIADRLAELQTLHTSGALTEEEYTSRRAQIIGEI